MASLAGIGFHDHLSWGKVLADGYRLATFAAKARDEVDLDSLAAEILHVIRETMQPERASIWIKNPSNRKPNHASQ